MKFALMAGHSNGTLFILKHTVCNLQHTGWLEHNLLGYHGAVIKTHSVHLNVLDPSISTDLIKRPSKQVKEVN